MSQIIGSLYQIVEEIGYGGAGKVFLAYHQRLGKYVILKADKRRLTTRPELLRREVDILKNLHHSYIPHVYDFFEENGIVYTVMDYVEGESLDKPLKRGERFPQVQVICWAIQILEALRYLHSPIHGNPPRGYVHSDIKPANLMRTPQNEICLIDFNIALALGEENVIGRSAGYSSPEYYRLDYSAVKCEYDNKKEEEFPTETIDEQTDTLHSSGVVYRKFIPDVRSDIYSVGATLYHLLCGVRPAVYPKKVIPLSDKQFSPPVVRIISKAMSINPENRYQSAEEMLYDFMHLRENDPRTIRMKRRNRIAFGITVAAFGLGIVSAFTGLKRIQATESGLKLAEYSKNAMEAGDVEKAIQYALEAIPEKTGILNPPATSEAQNALTEALGVYDLTDGYKKFGTVQFEKNLRYMTVAPDGKTAVCICEDNINIVDIQNRTIVTSFPSADSAMAEAEYLDNDTVVYAGKDGITAYSISKEKLLWCGQPATAVAVARSGNIVAAVNGGENCAVIYDAVTGQKTGEIDFGQKRQDITMVSENFANPGNNLFEINDSGTCLAVSFEDGSLELFDLQKGGNSSEILKESFGGTYFSGGFFENYFAFSAANAETSFFGVIDNDQNQQTMGMESDGIFHVQTDEAGIYVQIKNILVQIDPITGEQIPLVTTDEAIRQFAVGTECTAIATQNKILSFDKNAQPVTEMSDISDVTILSIAGDKVLYGRIDNPVVGILRYEKNTETEILRYDPAIDHDEARISADGKTVMLFSYKGFSVLDMNGNVIMQNDLPDAEMIYDQQFVRDGTESYLQVFYSDGRLLTFDASDGMLLRDEMTEKPDIELDEVFYTEDYRIEAPLHEASTVYDKKSGKKLCELNEDAFLTYVTQVNDYIIAQYVTAEGYCYGALLDKDCSTLAYLPYLKDIIDEQLIFDYPTGTIRTSRIYDLGELVEMAKKEVETAGEK